MTKVLSWARKKENLRIVSDQIGSPTWSRTLAEVVAQAIVLIKSKGNAWVSEKSGIYHVAGRGNVSRYEWAKKILQHDPNRGEQVVKTVNPAHSDEFETAAKRPRNSSLDTRLFQATFNMGMSDWLTSLKIALSTFYHYP